MMIITSYKSPLCDTNCSNGAITVICTRHIIQQTSTWHQLHHRQLDRVKFSSHLSAVHTVSNKPNSQQKHNKIAAFSRKVSNYNHMITT